MQYGPAIGRLWQRFPLVGQGGEGSQWTRGLYNVVESLKQFTEEYAIPYRSLLDFRDARGLRFPPFDCPLTLCVHAWEEPLTVGCLREL
jgi:hypothetical protein